MTDKIVQEYKILRQIFGIHWNINNFDKIFFDVRNRMIDIYEALSDEHKNYLSNMNHVLPARRKNNDSL